MEREGERYRFGSFGSFKLGSFGSFKRWSFKKYTAESFDVDENLPASLLLPCESLAVVLRDPCDSLLNLLCVLSELWSKPFLTDLHIPLFPHFGRA